MQRHSTPRSIAVAVLLAAITAGSAFAAPPAGAAEPATTSPAASTRKMALGMFMAPDRDLSVLDGFTASMDGNAPAIWAVWGNWGDSSGVFPTAVMAGLRDRGVTPMFVWQPYDSTDPDSPRYRYKRIVNGAHDDYIREWAQAAKAHGGTILLRFAHEMDGFWFPWGMGRFDNTPKNFIAAWRHVWRIFRGKGGVGATNVRFVWTPTYPGSKRPSFASLYPGDRYVDYVGFTSFNWNRRDTGWRSMVRLYAPPIRALAKITRKRIIVAETGSTARGGDKPAWIRKGYPAVYKKWPRVKVIVYFNARVASQGRDWRLTSPVKALAAYRNIATQVRFQGRIQ